MSNAPLSSETGPLPPGPRLLTFGCRLNIAESDAMRRHAVAAGLNDAIIVNTCAVTGEAVRQAMQAIRRARREHPAARIVVTGCAAQTDLRDRRDIERAAQRAGVVEA